MGRIKGTGGGPPGIPGPKPFNGQRFLKQVEEAVSREKIQLFHGSGYERLNRESTRQIRILEKLGVMMDYETEKICKRYDESGDPQVPDWYKYLMDTHYKVLHTIKTEKRMLAELFLEHHKTLTDKAEDFKQFTEAEWTQEAHKIAQSMSLDDLRRLVAEKETAVEAKVIESEADRLAKYPPHVDDPADPEGDPTE